ncbi:MAG: hypothetical protein Q4B59_01525 [Lachnospiraceae bacterium]|nr:hypothetical protein [Lachnospiraceae bacterium]
MKKIKSYIPRICEALELMLALLVMVGIGFSIYNLIFRTGMFGGLLNGETGFVEFLEHVFTIVIGIEFLEMLCRPNAANVLEVLIFLVARHMIIGEKVSVMQDFLSVLSVCLLCVVRRYLRINLRKIEKEEALEHEHELEHAREMSEGK